MRLRRSDFIEATYAFSFVLANFGIAIAARMPMMTTTINSSIRVKPFLLDIMRVYSQVKVESLMNTYWQIGSPSTVEPPPSSIVQVFAVELLFALAFQPVFVTVLSVTVMPVDAL